MELEMVKYLAELGKLSLSDEALVRFSGDMTEIIALMDTIKDIDIQYDARLDNANVFLPDLRADVSVPSMETAKVLKNAVNAENCFVVPKVVE
ncbi:MAG: Asp-tRNA(Asn)/Glu-tRNA(Gln) amidotransferase subunit GatC [Oscillospiraceae bacterium]